MTTFRDKVAYKLIVLFLVFAVGAATGAVFANARLVKKIDSFFNAVRPIRDTTAGFAFISPLLAYDTPESKDLAEFKPLEKSLQSYIDEQRSSGHLVRASVYFRSLKSGRWVGLSEDEQYTPASLLKVPLLVGYLKMEETRPDVLAQKLTTTDGVDLNAAEAIKPEAAIEQGKAYTVADLLGYMIKHSDNNATSLLFSAADQNFTNEVFSDLQVPMPPTDDAENFVRVKNYAFVFRLLYNATYIRRTSSEQALALLSQTAFKDGIVAGVPETMQVAHKFGEHGIIRNGAVEQEQLHDCGIVYYPGRPYELCIFTEGKDLAALKRVIAHLSELTYHSVESNPE